MRPVCHLTFLLGPTIMRFCCKFPSPSPDPSEVWPNRERGGREGGSNRSQTEIDLKWCMAHCMMCDDHCSSARHGLGLIFIPHEIKLHMNNPCVCFRFDDTWPGVEATLAKLCFCRIFYIYRRFFFYYFLPWRFNICVSVCVGACATEQRRFWRGILEMDGLLKIF